MKAIARILDAIEQHGPMSAVEIANVLGIKYEAVRFVIAGYRQATPPGSPRALRVYAYARPRTIKGKRAQIFEISGEPDVTYVETRKVSNGNVNDFRAKAISDIDSAIANMLPVLRAQAGNPFGVAMAQCGVRA
ncbi:hypothetical protein WM40_25510 [Robbsia andropogonis]|uniref:Uncharacterized protein n=1 Tax=Robbsia andropogonis TaxID=28092 RepID=A0A0F5JT84_9BURK|nr:hypothetical protein [Robbsia andropogonis]KKB61041.1 hypothetical protein WM40_25510 [Robbsia andropogonis]